MKSCCQKDRIKTVKITRLWMYNHYKNTLFIILKNSSIPVGQFEKSEYKVLMSRTDYTEFVTFLASNMPILIT